MTGLRTVSGKCSRTVVLSCRKRISRNDKRGVFLIRNRSLRAPSVTSSGLGNVAESSVVAITHSLNCRIIRRIVSERELCITSRMFFAKATTRMAPVHSVSREAVNVNGEKPVSRGVRSTFFSVMRTEIRSGCN